jgi:hypothetical protein
VCGGGWEGWWCIVLPHSHSIREGMVSLNLFRQNGDVTTSRAKWGRWSSQV